MVATTLSYDFPPTNGTVDPAHAIDFNLNKNSDHLFAVLYDLKSTSKTELTFGQLARAAHLAAHVINPGAAIPQGTNVGILVSTSSVMYIAMVLGVIRAGLVPFPLSPRTPVAGIANMLAQTNTSHVIAGGGPAIGALTSALQSDLSELNIIPLPSLDDIFPYLSNPASEVPHRPFPALHPTTDSSILAILHSSGSTGMPRPVLYDRKGIFLNLLTQPGVTMYKGPGIQVGTMGIPTFHMMGVIVQCFSPLYIGYTQVLFHPNSQPLIPSPDLTMQAVTGTECQLLVTAPTFLEVWSHSEDSISRLKQLDCIIFGGGPLSEWVGEKLIKQGVRLYSGYGATELGAVIEGYNTERDPNDWAYVQFSQQSDIRLVPQDDSDGSCEIVAVVCEAHRPWVLNFEVDGNPAYRTNDLVVPHPTKPGLWRIIGRLDDQIILQNGEKTNPGPMEIEITDSPLVQSSILFGRARNQMGVLIELAESAKANYEDRAGLDAIILVDPTRPLPRTPKGTISRSGSLKAYAKEIEDMYAVLEGAVSASGEASAPESWIREEAVGKWIQSCAENVLGRKVEVGGDLFQQGMDSLTATMLFRTLKSALHSSKDPTIRKVAEDLNQQTLFSHPTIDQLAHHIVQTCTGQQTSSTNPLSSIHSMIQKYDSKWTDKTIPLELRSGITKERVLVTGTTGGLGSHLLAVLLESDKVERVWALNRKSKEGIRQRQKAAFEDKMLNMGLLESERLVMVEAVLEDGKLGLDEKEYQEIQASVTSIIHNAWQVNFNLSLQSFEPTIQGARNLLDLAFSSPSPPRFLFTSSISAAGFRKSGQCVKEEYLEVEDAADGIGYGQSKLVTEKILESARAAGLETCIVRLGQLTGDNKSGAWSVSDWVPSMIASSVSVEYLPTTIGSVSWLPLDVAAQSIFDACTSRAALLPPVIHSSHPRPVEWTHIIGLFADALKSRTRDNQPLAVAPFGEWNKRVRSAALAFPGFERDRYKRFPSTKIQGTFDGIWDASHAPKGAQDDNMEAGGVAQLETTRAEQLSESLRNTPRLGMQYVKQWVGYWEKRDLFV